MVGSCISFQIALANVSAPSLQPLGQAGLVFQFLLDATLFRVLPNQWQAAGLAIVSLSSACHVSDALK